MTTQNQLDLLYALLMLLLQSGMIGAVFVALRRYAVAHLGVNRTAMAIDFATQAVQAAEQIYKNTASATGSIKFDSALARAKDMASAHGITLTDSQWNTLIESAVQQLRGGFQLLDAPVLESSPPVVINTHTTTVSAPTAAAPVDAPPAAPPHAPRVHRAPTPH